MLNGLKTDWDIDGEFNHVNEIKLSYHVLVRYS